MAASGAPLDLTPVLGPERAALLELLRGLPAGDWELPTECPGWSTKGVALHILGDDLSLLARQRDRATNGLIQFAGDHPGLTFRELLDGFNEQWVAGARFLSTELVIELLARVGEASEAFYCAVGLDTVSGEPVGLFGATDVSPYWQVIAREYLERFVHQSQIRRAVGAPELGGELADSVARVAVHVLAAAMRGYAAPTGACITIDFGPTAIGTLERDEDRWVVNDGEAPGVAAARIVVAPTATVGLVTRAFSNDEVVARLTIAGDESLARGAVDVIGLILARPAS